MNLALLIMPLIGGYVFLSSWNFTKFKAVSDSGYRLFFKSAFFGMVLLISAKIILFTLTNFMILEYIEKIVIPTGLNLESVLAMMLGVVAPHFLNIKSNADLNSKQEALNRGNQLFLTIRESLLNVELVELSMTNGKVYIGFPVGMDLGDEYVKINPYASGYRDVETKILIITFKYEAIDYMSLHEKELFVSVKVDEIISVKIFYPEIHSETEKDINEVEQDGPVTEDI